MEKAALDDPFLADALEGYKPRQASMNTDLSELHTRLSERTGREQGKLIAIAGSKQGFNWWKLAAMVILIVGAGWLVFQLGFDKNETEIAQATKKPVTQESPSDSAAPTGSASTTITDSPILRSTANDVPVKKPMRAERNYTPQHADDQNKSTEKEIAKEKTSAPATALSEKVPGIAVEEQAQKKEQQERDIASVDGYRNQSKLPVADGPRAKSVQLRKAQVQSAEGFNKPAENKAYRQTNIFRGRVMDAQNNALPFSNITNTSDSIGTYADANGYFNLISPDSVLKVRISSIGFEPSIVSLETNLAGNNIKLEEDRSSLSEVVISDKKVNSNRAKNNMVLSEVEPADGWSNYDLYLANNLKEPEVYKKESGIHGEVELSFEVNKLGEPINISVKKSLCDICDKEAIRLLQQGPKWKRKARKGKGTVTIRF